MDADNNEAASDVGVEDSVMSEIRLSQELMVSVNFLLSNMLYG